MTTKLTPKALQILNALSYIERVAINNDKFTTRNGLMSIGDVSDLPPVPRESRPNELSIREVLETYRRLAASTPKDPTRLETERIHNGYLALKQLYNFNRDLGNALGANLPAVD